MHSKQHKFRGFPEFPGLSCILIATAEEMAMYNDKLAPETEPRSVTFFSTLEISPTRVIYWRSSK